MARRKGNARVRPRGSHPDPQAQVRSQVGQPLIIRTRLALAAALAILASSALGCRLGGGKSYSNENDRLRRENLALTQSVEQLRAERNELISKLAAYENGAANGLPKDAAEALPRVAGLELGRLSGPVDSDQTPGVDVIDIYVEPYDGRRRFLQITGTLTVEAALLESPDAESIAAPIGRATLSPLELRDAHRTSPLGAHYTVRIPLQTPNQPLRRDLLLRATFQDALTGRTFEVTRVIERRPAWLAEADQPAAASR